ncbi:MAG: hypothetical protein IIA41_07430, partial [SAR324 cluster bacterium]|nr:hypothetical protein [SAR324 cluster bacterium]
GFEVKPMLYTRPKAFREELGMSYGYEKRAVLFVPIKAPAELPDGEVELGVVMSWLVCKRICLLGNAEATVKVRVGEETLPTASLLST